MLRVLLIVPAYNEEANILRVVNTIRAFKDARTHDFELDYVVINDASTDNTLKICRTNNIHCIDLDRNLGIGGAVQTGYIYANKANYDIAVQFDGDGQHDIMHLTNLIAPIIHGEADLTIGSRFVSDLSGFKSTKLRRLGILILSRIANIFGGLSVKDITSGYRAANKNIIGIFAEEYPSDYPEPESLVFLSKKGYRLKEVGVGMFERTGGESSIRALKSLYYMIKVSLAVIITALQTRERL